MIIWKNVWKAKEGWINKFISIVKVRPYLYLQSKVLCTYSLVQSNLAIRNFLNALKLFLNAKSSLFLWSKWQIGHRKWFLNTNLFLIKPFYIGKIDCIRIFTWYHIINGPICMITLRKHHYCLKTYFPWQTLYVHAVFVLARNVDAISTSPMSELCELRRLRALEDSRLSPATPRQAKQGSTATEAALLRWHTVARHAARSSTHGEEKHGRKGKEKAMAAKTMHGPS